MRGPADTTVARLSAGPSGTGPGGRSDEPARRASGGQAPPVPAQHALMTALEGLASPAYVFDRTGQIRWLNAAAVRILGNRVGEPYANMVAPHARHVAQAQFARKIVGEGGTVFDLDALDRDGNPITVKITSAPLRVDGAIVGVFGVAVPLPGDGAPVAESLVSKLTPRQLETLRLLADGLPTPEVAERLGVAVETARNHIRAVLRALDVHTRLEAVVKAIRTGLLA